MWKLCNCGAIRTICTSKHICCTYFTSTRASKLLDKLFFSQNPSFLKTPLKRARTLECTLFPQFSLSKEFGAVTWVLVVLRALSLLLAGTLMSVKVLMYTSHYLSFDPFLLFETYMQEYYGGRATSE